MHPHVTALRSSCQPAVSLLFRWPQSSHSRSFDAMSVVRITLLDTSDSHTVLSGGCR